MKLSSILLAPFGLMAMVSAAAVPAADGAPLSAEIEVRSEDFNSTDVELMKRQNALCSPTGRESCNLNIRSWIPAFSAGYNRVAYLYNYECRQIGYKGLGAVSKTHSMYSELRYTVELTITGGGFNPTGYFWYAGRRTDLNNQVCGHWGTDRSCRVAFRCD